MKNRDRIIRWLLAIALIFSAVACKADPGRIEACNLSDLQQCHSCTELANSVNMQDPDHGEYYRGALWNGLYTAFKLNCQKVGRDLLENRANPNMGGSFGSFLASLVSAWPHNNEEINQAWAEMLSGQSVDINWKNPYTDMSARELINHQYVDVNYPKVWKFIETTSKKSEGMLHHEKQY